jgi:type II secretory pathway predicted ATPase ExeA
VIDKLQSHYGFTKTPFGRSLAPQMLHRHSAHAEAVARIGWCVTERALGVITGEVGAGKTVAIRAALGSLDTSRHTVIYLGNPAVGGRGLYAGIVAALGGVPRFHKAPSSRRPSNCSPPKTTNAAAPSCSSSTKPICSMPTSSKNCGY